MEDRIRQIAISAIETAVQLLKAIGAMLPAPAVFALRAALAFLQWLIEEWDNSNGNAHAQTPAQ